MTSQVITRRYHRYVLDKSGARDKVLLHGLVDRVPLERVHYEVAQANGKAPLQDVQRKTMNLIDTLVGERLFVIGNLIDNGARFEPWNTPLPASIQRLRDMYIDGYNDCQWPS